MFSSVYYHQERYCSSLLFLVDRLDHCLGLMIKYAVIALLKETNTLNFAFFFVKISILNEERKPEWFFGEFGHKF